MDKIEAAALASVAGPRASKDPAIYDATVEVLRTFMDMAGVEGDLLKKEKPPGSYPETVKEAVPVFYQNDLRPTEIT